MKKATFVLRWILMLLVCLGTFAAASSASSAGKMTAGGIAVKE